jgi:DNA-binding IclR family transcriptional regulator
VETGFDVLTEVRLAGGPISLSDLSSRTGLAPSKLHRYLVSLLRAHALRQSPDTGHYDLGPAVRTLGIAALSRFDGFDIAVQAASAISTELKANAFIYVWAEAGPVLIKTIMTFPTISSLRIGSSIPLLSSGCGPIFLAYLPTDITAPVLAQRGERPSDGAPDPSAVAEAIRASGIHWATDSVLSGFLVCAVPIFDGDGDLLCTIGVTIPKDRSSEARAVASLMSRVSRKVSAELGAPAAQDRSASNDGMRNKHLGRADT